MALPLGLSLIPFCVNIFHDNRGCSKKPRSETLLEEAKKKKEKKYTFINVTERPYPLLQGRDSPAIDAAVLVVIRGEGLSELSCWTLQHSEAETAFLDTEGGMAGWAQSFAQCCILLSCSSSDTAALDGSLAGSNHLAGVVIGSSTEETEAEEWDLMKTSI